jgi:hypothetical protein
MLSQEEQQTVWIDAYNAALTGLLSSRTSQARPSEGDIQVIAGQCRAFADQAVKDADAYTGR